MRSLFRRGRLWLIASAVGGNALVLSGCDPTVRDTVLGGVENSATTLFTTFIHAFFQSLTAGQDQTGQTNTI